MVLAHALVLVSALLTGPAPTAAVVAIEVDAELQQRMAKVTDWNAAVERTVLDTLELQRRLTGLPSPRLADPASMRALLEKADDLEAHFDSPGAIAKRREALVEYENSVLPSVDLQVLAARALHDIAATELSEGHDREALEASRVAQRRFPNVPLDSTRHPPAVSQLMKRAFIELKRQPQGELTIITNRRARAMADGMSLGDVEGKRTVKLLQGTWRIWLADDNGTSLVHDITVTSTPATVDIDMVLESALAWTPVPLLRCADDCDTLLRILANRARVDEAVGLSLGDNTHAPATGQFVRATDGTSSSRPVSALADLSPPIMVMTSAPPEPDHFSGWSLVPFGVGQLAQKRYVAGSVYAGLQAGLLAWNVVEATHAQSENAGDESSRRKRQNTSAGLLIGAMVASVAEALIVDAVSD